MDSEGKIGIPVDFSAPACRWQPLPLTIYDLLLIIVFLRGESKFQKTIYRQDLQDLHRCLSFSFHLVYPCNPVYFKLISTARNTHDAVRTKNAV